MKSAASTALFIQVVHKNFTEVSFVLQVVKDTPLQELPRVLKKAADVTGADRRPPSPTSSVASSDAPEPVKIDTETGTVQFTADRIKVDGRRHYKCSGCGAVYVSAAACRGHILKVHKGTPLVCTWCDWSTFNSDALLAHEKKDHGDKLKLRK